MHWLCKRRLMSHECLSAQLLHRPAGAPSSFALTDTNATAPRLRTACMITSAPLVLGLSTTAACERP